MGIARLLAKGWIMFCLFAGAHALRIALASGVPLGSSLFAIGICVLLFAAMGLLFVGGFGVSAGMPRHALFGRGWGWGISCPASMRSCSCSLSCLCFRQPGLVRAALSVRQRR